MMIRALSFTGDVASLQVPPINADLSGGLALQVWVFRSRATPRQRLLELLSPDGGRWLLDTGTEPATLVLAQERGGQRFELQARGALPEARWIKLTLTLAASGANLSVCDLPVVSGALGPAPARGPLTLLMAGSTSDSRFIGALCDLRIYQNVRQSESDLWARYLLDAAIFLRSETVRPEVTRSYYNILDSSGQGHHITTTAPPAVATFEEPLRDSTTPALRLQSAGAGLRLSPSGGLAQGLTAEVWLRPATAGQARSVLTIDFAQTALVLSAGDVNGALTLSLLGKTPMFSGTRNLLVLPHLIQQERWCHIAFTLQVEKIGGTSRVSCALYQQGQLRGRASLTLAIPGFFVLGALAATVNLGGASSGRYGFAGHLSEVRLFSGVLGEADIGARWLTRLAGDETNLRACYRLDETYNSCTRDLSARLGVAVLPEGATIEPITDLPLPSALSSAGPRVVSSGKLVKETLLREVMTRVGDNAPVTRQVRMATSLYDATIEPRAPSGQPYADQALEIRVDRAVSALRVDSQGIARNEAWVPGQSYTQTLPANGVARLRFQADDLSCPTLRVRIAGMPGGLWAIVRPDAVVHDKLRTLSQADLRRPGDGRPSPLPSNTSDDDAAALTTALTSLGKALPPVPPANRSVAEDRGIFDVFVKEVGGAVNSGLDALGDLGDAITDVSQDALRDARRLPKTAGQLVARSVDQVNALVSKARQVPARLGVDAITSYIAAADSLAVVAAGGIGDVVHNIEVVGTSLVKDGTAVWRVVVSGVSEALAAMKAIINRIGAEVAKIIEYLAYLFKWSDFLKAADEAYAYMEQAIATVPTYLQGLDGLKPGLQRALNQVVDTSALNRSLAQNFGFNVSPDTPGVAELDYVMEQFQKVMEVADLALSGGAAGAVAAAVGAEASPALLSSASGALSKLALERFTNPVALLTTPVGQLIGQSASLSGSTGDVVDYAFQAMKDGAQEGVDQALGLLKARLYVPGLTPLLEETILGGKTLCVLRIIALLCGIASVLTDKLARSARGDGRRSAQVSQALVRRATVVSRTGDGTQPSAPDPATQPAHLSPLEIWVPTLVDLVMVLLIAIQTYQEILKSRMDPKGGSTANVKKLKALEEKLNGINVAVGFLGFLKGIFDLGIATKQPPPLQSYAATVGGLETLSGAYMMMSGIRRSKGKSIEFLDKCDPVMLGLFSCGIIGTQLTPVFKGYLKGQQTQIQYGLGSAALIVSMITRLLSAFDNSSAKAKYVTIGLVVLSGATDLTSAIYGHATSFPSK